MGVQDPRALEVRTLLDRYGLSYRWLARAIETSHTNINSWLDEEFGNAPRDRSIYNRMVQAIEEEIKRSKRIGVTRGGMVHIPIYAPIRAGSPDSSLVDLEFEEIPEWGGDFMRWGRPIDGDSMERALMYRDIAIFESSAYESGHVVHAYSDGEDCVKAIRTIGTEIKLWSFNEQYPPFDAAGWKAKGVCVARIRYGRFKVRQYTEFPGGLRWAMRNEDF